MTGLVLQHYEVGGISNVTTEICGITQANSVTYHYEHSRTDARAVCLGGTKIWGAHFVNEIDEPLIKNNYDTFKLLEARSLDLSCFNEEHLW